MDDTVPQNSLVNKSEPGLDISNEEGTGTYSMTTNNTDIF